MAFLRKAADSRVNKNDVTIIHDSRPSESTQIHDQLYHWLQQAHQQIDQYYARKVTDIQNQIKNGEIDFNQSQLVLKPISIDEDSILIQIPRTNSDLQNIFRSPIEKVSLLTDRCFVVNQNHQFILACLPTQINIYDYALNLCESKEWSGDAILDMCHIEINRKFFLLTEECIFTLDDEDFHIRTSHFSSNVKGPLIRCATDEQCLFLVSLDHYSTIKKFYFEDDTLHFTGKQRIFDENIMVESIYCQNENLATITFDPVYSQRFIDISRSDNFQRLWNINIDITTPENFVFCRSFDRYGWIIVDYNNKSLLFVGNDGQTTQTILFNFSIHALTVLNSKSIVLFSDRNIILYKID